MYCICTWHFSFLPSLFLKSSPDIYSLIYNFIWGIHLAVSWVPCIIALCGSSCNYDNVYLGYTPHMPIMGACYCDGLYIHTEEWLTPASAFFTSFSSMCCKSQKAVLKKRGLVEYEKMFPFGSEDMNNYSNRKKLLSSCKTVLFLPKMSFIKRFIGQAVTVRNKQYVNLQI